MSGCVGVKQQVEDTEYPAPSLPPHPLDTEFSLWTWSQAGAKKFQKPCRLCPQPRQCWGYRCMQSSFTVSPWCWGLEPSSWLCSEHTYLLMDLPSSLLICLTMGEEEHFIDDSYTRGRRQHMLLFSKVNLTRTMLCGFQQARKKNVLTIKKWKLTEQMGRVNLAWSLHDLATRQTNPWYPADLSSLYKCVLQLFHLVK